MFHHPAVTPGLRAKSLGTHSLAPAGFNMSAERELLASLLEVQSLVLRLSLRAICCNALHLLTCSG